MLRIIALSFFMAVFSHAAHAQMERTIYQVFEPDSATVVTLDIAGEYEVIAWAGSNILAETNIKVWHASPVIVKDLIKNGRYAMASKREGNALSIATKERDRKPLKTRKGEVTELAKVKFFVPDTFTWPEGAVKQMTKKDPLPAGQ